MCQNCSKELAKTYDPKSIEDRLYKKWEDNGYFHAEVDRSKKPFTIVMPPPNVTGQLHMGHAVDNTMQDILIRTKRMQGYAALWVPGTDHASIATEAKVVEAMRAEGLTKEMVGRDGFLERAWAWKTKYGNRIVSQLKKLGSSCDWERERFTMDEGCSEAVKEVFVRLYDKGLIYRGNRMVNWCPHCNTSISDAEVVFEEKVFGGSVPKNFFPAVEKGVRLAAEKGVLAGYPVVGLKATLLDGSYHPVDSSEMAFIMAAKLAYKAAMPEAGPVILEPIHTLKAHVPNDNTGDIMGDVTKRRGRVLGMEPDEDGMQTVIAEVPLAELSNFTTFIRQITQGRGWFTTEFARYEILPEMLVPAVVEQAKKLGNLDEGAED